MAPHSRTLAWQIPWTEEPGRLQSMGSLGVGHTGEEWRNSSRKNEETKPKQKQHPVVDVTGDGSKV